MDTNDLLRGSGKSPPSRRWEGMVSDWPRRKPRRWSWLGARWCGGTIRTRLWRIMIIRMRGTHETFALKGKEGRRERNEWRQKSKNKDRALPYWTKLMQHNRSWTNPYQLAFWLRALFYHGSCARLALMCQIVRRRSYEVDESNRNVV